MRTFQEWLKCTLGFHDYDMSYSNWQANKGFKCKICPHIHLSKVLNKKEGA